MFRQVCPFATLKERFITSLNDIRKINNAFHFCDLILDAKKIIANPTLRQTPSLLKRYGNAMMGTSKVISNFKSITDETQLEHFMVDGLFHALHSTEEHSDKKKLMQLLYEVNNSISQGLRYNNTEEYLRHLIIAAENIIKSYNEGGLHSVSFHKVSQYNLDELRSTLYESTVNKAERLLVQIFLIGRTRLGFSEEEMKQVGTLMVGAINPIKLCIYCTPVYSGNGLETSILRKRSSLQFLIDDFGKFPVRNGALLKNFYEDKIKNSMQILDSAITMWCEYVERRKSDRGTLDESDVEDSGESDRENLGESDWEDLEKDMELLSDDDYETDYEEIVSDMPESHTWWAKCSQIPRI